MDFTLPPEIESIRLRVRAFIEEHVLPLEADPANFSEHENIPSARLAPVREKAKAAGLWAPQVPKEFGGMALPIVGWAAIYEEAARSVFGPLAIHCMAPDDGNMNLIAKVGTPAQKEKWLRPIADGKVRSAFAMTEPHPGSGSDPAMMLTRAEKKSDRYIVRGRKWFITGADGASHYILIARTGEDTRNGLTAFLYHKDQPGWRILRRIPIMGPEEHGGHCEIEYDGLEIPLENVLMKALEKDREKRYQTAWDFQYDLDQFLSQYEFTPSNIHLSNFLKQLFFDELEEEKNRLAAARRAEVAEEVISAAEVISELEPLPAQADEPTLIRHSNERILTVPLDGADYERLARIAGKNGATVTSLVKEILGSWLKYR